MEERMEKNIIEKRTGKWKTVIKRNKIIFSNSFFLPKTVYMEWNVRVKVAGVSQPEAAPLEPAVQVRLARSFACV
jgi:hypothetical protein